MLELYISYLQTRMEWNVCVFCDPILIIWDGCTMIPTVPAFVADREKPDGQIFIPKAGVSTVSS
jgi:hypothetical protein